MTSLRPSFPPRAARAIALLLPLTLLAPRTVAADSVTVGAVQKISNLEGGFGGGLLATEQWGISAESIGDLDGDGVGDLAVGQPRQDDVGLNGFGAVWILFMNADGTVKGEVEITPGLSGFDAVLEDGDQFGTSIAALGDLDGDGAEDIAVGARQDGPGFGHGGLYVLLLNVDGTVKTWTHVTNGTAGLVLDNSDAFGTDMEAIGDFDGDGVTDLAVGASFDGDGAFGSGSVYLLFLNAAGGVKTFQKISNSSGSLGTFIPAFTRFGQSVSHLGDLDGDGVSDLAVGTLFGTEADGTDSGAVYIVFLEPGGTVKATTKISEGLGGFTGTLDDNDSFGFSVAALGDVDGDGVTDLAVGATQDDDAANGAGAVWVLCLATDGTVVGHTKIASGQGGFTLPVAGFAAFGSALARIDDLDGDGYVELVIGSSLDSSAGFETGAVYVCSLEPLRFEALGFALPGAGGEMPIAFDGELAGGDPITMQVTNAPPLSPAYMLMSPTAAFAPVLGGTVVPNVDDPARIVAALITDGAGELLVSSTWPAGLAPGFSVYVQVWVADATAPFGWAATQGVRVIQP